MLPHSKPRSSAPYWRKDVTVSSFGAWCLRDARFAWSRFALCRIFTLTNVRANLVLPNSRWLVLPRHFRCQLFSPRERERDREPERNRDRDSETERETERDRQRHRVRQRKRDTDRQIDGVKFNLLICIVQMIISLYTMTHTHVIYVQCPYTINDDYTI